MKIQRNAEAALALVIGKLAVADTDSAFGKVMKDVVKAVDDYEAGRISEADLRAIVARYNQGQKAYAAGLRAFADGVEQEAIVELTE